MFKKIFSDEFGKGAIILFITMNLFNVLNFLFHFIMGRMLGPEKYGVLAVLMSLIAIYNVPSEAIQNLISNYTSKFNLKKEFGKIRYLMTRALKKGFIISVFIFIIVAFLTLFLSKFLNINFWLVLMTNLIVFYSFLSPIPLGVLQGKKKFGLLGWNMVMISFLKLFFAIYFVILGWGLFGAMGGLILGIGAGFIISIYFNKDILEEKEEKVHFDGIYPKSVPYFIVMIVIFSALSLDIILARRFFSPELAGQYSVLSMIGKTIFFITGAIGKAMFPLTSEKTDDKKASFKLFRKSLLWLVIISLTMVFSFTLIPQWVINLLYGSQYLEMAPFLIYSGISLSFLAFANLVLIYKLSQNKLKKSYYLFVFLAIDIFLLYMFHSNILEYTLAFMVSNIIMFIGSLFFLKK
jgi:O-antigen/teichoic acid export membrane protein